MLGLGAHPRLMKIFYGQVIETSATTIRDDQDTGTAGKSPKVSSSYIWDPLPREQQASATRIVELLPTSSRDQQLLRCRIRAVSLDDHPIYEAISYCWEGRERTEAIEVEEADGDVSQLLITPNLLAALGQLAPAQSTECAEEGGGSEATIVSRPRRLWVDAISINQEDDTEKGQQVQMMNRIFRQAQKTIVWLGDHEAQCEKAIPMIGLIGQFRESPELRDLFCGAGTKFADIKWTDIFYLACAADGDLALIMSAFQEFMKLPYFTRIWVVQELTVAAEIEVRLGAHEMDPSDIMDVLIILAAPGALSAAAELGGSALQTMALRALKVWNKTAPRKLCKSMSDHLLMTTGLRAADDRDLVYSLLGLVEDRAKFRSRPNYGPGATVHRVFVDVAKDMLEFEEPYRLLCLDRGWDYENTHDKLPGRKLPSWVPDWRATDRLSPLWVSLDGKCSYKAGGDSSLVWAVLDQDRLALRGILIRLVSLSRPWSRFTIEHLPTTSLEEMVDQYELYPAIEKFVTGPGSPGSETDNYEDLLDVYWQTIVAGHLHDTFEQTKEAFLAWRQGLHLEKIANMALCEDGDVYRTPDGQTMAPLEPEGPVKQAFENLEAFRKENGFLTREFEVNLGLPGRRLAWTECRRLCLVPHDAEEDDLLFLPVGCPFPLIVRRAGEKRYLLVGAAYTHGCMYGEIWTKERKQHIEEVIIV